MARFLPPICAKLMLYQQDVVSKGVSVTMEVSWSSLQLQRTLFVISLFVLGFSVFILFILAFAPAPEAKTIRKPLTLAAAVIPQESELPLQVKSRVVSAPRIKEPRQPVTLTQTTELREPEPQVVIVKSEPPSSDIKPLSVAKPEPVKKIEEPIVKKTKLPVSKYVVQLFGDWQKHRAQKFIDENQLNTVADIITLDRASKPWYVVILGEHDNYKAAREQLSTLDDSLKVQEPWIRELSRY